MDFTLAETSETVETLHPYGDVTSDKWVYRIIATIDKDGDVFIRHQAGQQMREYDEIEFEDCDQSIDFHKNDFDIDELQRFCSNLQVLRG